jgi:prepilin-type N-terminal cleavage/methylation domain-containing protein
MRSSALRHGHPANRAGTWPRVHPGFSLTELLVVMVVASALAYVAVPAIEVVRFRMDGAARGAVAALVSAQRLAVMRQHDVVVTFDAANHRLRIHEDRDNNGLVGEGEPTRVVAFDDGVVFGIGDARGLDGDAAAVTFTEMQAGLPALRYIRNGSASEEGSL